MIMENTTVSAQGIQDGTPLERIFTNSISRVLDFFILNQNFDYSPSDISKLSRVPPRTLERILPILREEKLIESTRKSGKAYMYRLNLASERASALQQYVRATLKENLNNPYYLKDYQE